MNRKISSLFALFLLLFLPLIANAASATAKAAGSPAGMWQTIDDVTGKPKAVVKISVSGGTLSGSIVSFVPSPGKTIDEVCENCTGAKHNKPIKGMTIVYGLRQDPQNPNLWSGGSILDPKNGKVYRCKMELQGNNLNVRGYIGFSLLGRTQVWHRMK